MILVRAVVEEESAGMANAAMLVLVAIEVEGRTIESVRTISCHLFQIEYIEEDQSDRAHNTYFLCTQPSRSKRVATPPSLPSGQYGTH